MTQATLFDKTPLIHKDDHFTEEQKTKSRKSAESQEARILKHFAERSELLELSAGDLWHVLNTGNEPLTSFRRALTNLAKQGKVEKLQSTEDGFYGKPEHLWRLIRDE